MDYIKKNKKSNIFTVILILILIFLYITFPGNFNLIKLSLLLIIVMYSFFLIIISKKIDRPAFLLTCLTISIVSMFFIMNGYYKKFELDFTIFQVYIFTPLSVYFITNLLKSKENVVLFLNGLRIVLSFLILYDFIYILGALGIIPQFITWEQNTSIVGNNFLTARLSNMNSLMFLLPMEYTNFILGDGIRKNISTNKLMFFNIIFGGIIVLLSGRRALQLVFLMSICIIILVKIVISKKTLLKINKSFLILFSTIIILICIFEIFSKLLGIDNLFYTFFNTLKNAFDTSSNSSIIRQQQNYVLLFEWKKTPIFGNGLTAFVDYYVRSQDTKWSYEHFYVALLYQTGIVGIMFYATIVIMIIKNLLTSIKNIKDKDLKVWTLSILVGFIAYLLASFTNPMITSLWPWILVTTVMSKKLYKET